MANGDSARNVFLDYSRDQLNAQYNYRQTHPEHPNIIEGWAKASAPLREADHCHRDQAYGELARQRFDLFLPEHFNGCLHLFIHGGYWQSMERRFYGYVGNAIAKTGAVGVIIDYSFAQQRPLAHILDEVNLAINTSYQQASRHGYSAKRLRLTGHGSGALMALATATEQLGGRLPLNIEQIDCLSGIYDLEPLRHLPLGEPLGITRESARALSPIYAHPRESLERIRLFIGGDETREVRRQNNALCAAWTDEEVTIEKHEIEHKHHFSLLEWYSQALRTNQAITHPPRLHET